MLTLNDGRSELWQWDTGRTLAVDADCSQVHFSNKVFGRSIDVDVADGVSIIPDVLLQTDKDLNVWAFVGTAENGYTKISKTFKVNRRNKPADYVFTPVEQTTIAEIAEIAKSVRDDADAGLFDGRDGVDGYTPIKGIDYFDGKDGTDGAPGADGKTPEYGVDYGTPEQITEIAHDAAERLRPEVNQINDDLRVLTVNYRRQDRRLRMIELAADGVLYTEETDTDTAYEKAIPSGALPYATLEKIGGATIADGDMLKSASVDKVLIVGKNILKPYPGYLTYGGSATTTVIMKGSEKNVVGLAEVKPGEKIKLTSISGASFANRRYFWFANNPIVRHDDIVSIGGAYGTSLYNGATLTVPENAKFLAVRMTATGDENQYWSVRRDLVTKYVPYFERELQIPDEIRSLQGYGQSNGEKVNTVDYANKVYHKAGYYGDDGQWVDNAEEIDISALIPDDFEIIDVEEAGTLTFHHPEADNGLPIPMPSKESYIVKTGGTAV